MIMEHMNTSTNLTFNSSSAQQFVKGDDGISKGVAISVYTVIFLFALVGNVLVIVTLIQNKRMRTVTNVFLMNLAVSDLLLALFCMPFSVIPMLMKNFIFGAPVCFLVRYLQGVSVGVSCFTLLSISLERYFAICRPLHSRRWQTLSHAYKMIGGIWIVALVCMVPIAVHTRYKEVLPGLFLCREVWTMVEVEKAYTVFLDASLLVLPLVVMSVAYGCVIYTLWNGIQTSSKEMGFLNGKNYGSQTSLDTGPLKMQTLHAIQNTNFSSPESTPQRKVDLRRLICHSNPERSRSAKLRVIRMLCVVVIEYFVCWSPFYALQTWRSFHEDSLKQHFSNLTFSLFFMLAFLSSACNPITYCLLNKRFRQSFRLVLQCLSIKPLRRFSSRSEPLTSTRTTGMRLTSTKINHNERLDVDKPTIVVCSGVEGFDV